MMCECPLLYTVEQWKPLQVTIAYPDDGSWKRFHTFLHNFPEVICTKIRVDGKKIVKLKARTPKSIST